MVDIVLSTLGPSGGTGIRARLKIVSRKGCGFDSHLGHKFKNLALARFLNLWMRVNKLRYLRVGIERFFVLWCKPERKIPEYVVFDKCNHVPTSGTIFM